MLSNAKLREEMGEAASITATLHDWEQLAKKIGKIMSVYINSSHVYTLCNNI